jgi:hypothetical protein
MAEAALLKVIERVRKRKLRTIALLKLEQSHPGAETAHHQLAALRFLSTRREEQLEDVTRRDRVLQSILLSSCHAYQRNPNSRCT